MLHFIYFIYYILSLFCITFYVLHFIYHCFVFHFMYYILSAILPIPFFYLLPSFFEFGRLESMTRPYIFNKFINSNLGLLKFNIFTYGFIIKSRLRKIWEFGFKLLIQHSSFHHILPLFSSYFTTTFIIFYHYLYYILPLFLPYFITTFIIFYYYLYHIPPLLSLYFTNQPLQL